MKLSDFDTNEEVTLEMDIKMGKEQIKKSIPTKEEAEKRAEKATGPITSKICSLCREDKPLSEYRKGKGKGNCKNYCKPCDDKKSHENYIKNQDKRKKQIKAWNDKNRKKLSEYAKKCVEESEKKIDNGEDIKL